MKTVASLAAIAAVTEVNALKAHSKDVFRNAAPKVTKELA